jgi:divalent metal cation (Fe/Co/Zn/Cd) transporter
MRGHLSKVETSMEAFALGSDAAVLHRRALRLEWVTISWNVVEAAVAITAGAIAGSAALIGFGVDSAIEVSSAVALLWRLRRAGPDANREARSAAERRALFFVGATFAALAISIAVESVTALMRRELPEVSGVGIALAVASLMVMPTLAHLKQRTGRDMGSRALVADAAETWVCAYLSVALLAGLGLYASLGWWWADATGALLMEPVIVWQAWETYREARSGYDD